MTDLLTKDANKLGSMTNHDDSLRTLLENLKESLEQYTKLIDEIQGKADRYANLLKQGKDSQAALKNAITTLESRIVTS